MNFDYIKDAEPETEELKNLYASLYKKLETAENTYWSKPQKCGMALRRAAENICHIYNSYYKIGFPESVPLEDYLCYTSNEEHNVMVSRFLSVVRTEQRDRLEWLRVWGDECIFMDENPEELQKNPDKIYINAKKMMVHMLMVTREMCEKIDGMKGIEDRGFEEAELPGYLSPAESENGEKEGKKEKWKIGIGIFKRK